MKGLTPAFTVRDLKRALDLCLDDSQVLIMPEDSDGYRIGGVLALNSQEPKQVWLLLEEDISDYERSLSDGDGPREEHNIDLIPDQKMVEKVDVVQIRGALKSA